MRTLRGLSSLLAITVSRRQALAIAGEFAMGATASLMAGCTSSNNSDASSASGLGEQVDLTQAKTVEFGSYSYETDRTARPITWYVVAEEEGRQYLLARDVLDAEVYNDEDVAVTWETCTLRQWLNKEFLTSAFSEEERERIAEVTLANEDNPTFSLIDGGNDTQDRLFCPSIAELGRYLGVRTQEQAYGEIGDDVYFSSTDEIYATYPAWRGLVAYPTPYALERGMWAYQVESEREAGGAARWWLRTPGGLRNAVYVSWEGVIIDSGTHVNSNGWAGVRPALWLNL